MTGLMKSHDWIREEANLMTIKMLTAFLCAACATQVALMLLGWLPF